jgi:hypothetical protein|tara:strand:+ start:11113 stop:12033 length:921 start_codon:yes stop_codon:yes gene_type:complete
MAKISYASVFDKLDQVRMGKVKEGLKFGQWNLDAHLRFKRGNFNIVLGHANVGKTSVVLYLMLLQSIVNDIKWLVFSSENTPVSLIKKLTEFFLGKPINKIEEDEFYMAQDLVLRYFIIIDTDKKMYTYKDLLEEATDIYHEEGFDGFFIDPYNSLVKDKEMFKTLGGHEYDYEVATHFRNWAKQHDVSIWLAAHAVTQALRMKYAQGHEYAGHPMPPSGADIEGGGKWQNRVDDMVVCHRLISHPTEWMYTQIHIRKIKEVETGGRPTPLDEPIRFRSLPNNVGFEIHGENLISMKEKKQGDLPF